MATRVDHKFALTKYGWINVLFVAFLIVVAWKPLFTVIGNIASSLAGVFSGAAK